MKGCRNLVNKEDALNIRKQCEILSVNRSSLYYAPVGESEENLEIMRKDRRALFESSHRRRDSCPGFFVRKIYTRRMRKNLNKI